MTNHPPQPHLHADLPAPSNEALARCKAMISALACADKGFTRAGVTFEQTAGQVTLVMHSGHVVAQLRGRFGIDTVIGLIRQNIAAHAKSVVAQLNRSLAGLDLPAGHSFRLDEPQNLHAILSRGATHLHGYLGGRVESDQIQFCCDFLFSLSACSAHVRLRAGDRFGDGESLLSPSEGLFRAESYDALADQIVLAVNSSIQRYGDATL